MKFLKIAPLFILLALTTSVKAKKHFNIKKTRKSVTKTLRQSIEKSFTENISLGEAIFRTQQKKLSLKQQAERTLDEAQAIIEQLSTETTHIAVIKKEAEINSYITKITKHLLEKHEKSIKKRLKETLEFLLESKAIITVYKNEHNHEK